MEIKENDQIGRRIDLHLKLYNNQIRNNLGLYKNENKSTDELHALLDALGPAVSNFISSGDLSTGAFIRKLLKHLLILILKE
jgi:hypothetical protein